MKSHVTDMDKLINGLGSAVNQLESVVRDDILDRMQAVVDEWKLYTRQRLVMLSEEGDIEASRLAPLIPIGSRPKTREFINFLRSEGTVVDRQNIQEWSEVWVEISDRCRQPTAVLSWASSAPDAMKYIRIKEPRFFISGTWQPLTAEWLNAGRPVQHKGDKQ